jgi:hypothetical protein
MIAITDIIFPDVKKVLIDSKEEDLYRLIQENKGKVI